MKVRSKKDTVSGLKKIVLIDNLTFSTNYDLAKDSLKWAPLSISGRTKLFKVLDVNYISAWDPYIIVSVWDPISKDTIGVRCNKFEYTTNHRLFRHTSTYWAFNINYTLSPNTFKKNSTEKTVTKETDLYSVPWSFNFFYMLNSNDDYSYPTFRKKNTIVQTLSFNGDISLTPKWKIGFNSGYDIVGKKLAYTEVHVNRDLHCWEMVLNWTPFGDRKHYDLTIRVKASVLQDLKLEKKSDNSYTY
jgi:hypothetical protein